MSSQRRSPSVIGSVARWSMCGSPRRGSWSATPSRRRGSMRCGNARSRWGGRPRRSTVVDEDTGRSGASTHGRIGFKELVADVGLGNVGLILALEVSRFARSSADWHQLIDLCALTGHADRRLRRDLCAG